MMNGNGRGGDGKSYRSFRKRNGSKDTKRDKRDGGRFDERNAEEHRNFDRYGGKTNRSGKRDIFFYPQDDRKNERGRFDKAKGLFVERPKWIPTKMSTEQIPEPVCQICKKPIKDLSLAFADKTNGEAVHFDCARESVQRSMELSGGDFVAYIGGGRFGVVNYPNPQSYNGIRIKQIIEWEKKELRSSWRGLIADHFSMT
ncbi:MAG: hypothetical protein LBD20_01120 [Spirochaetaceae bacterium]|jgi:hypothetical protein|nr:hypothetical protein [Spirochaetaceae bacterium]